MSYPYYHRNPYVRRKGACICPSPGPVHLAPSHTRGSYPRIQQGDIYVQGNDGEIVAFPPFLKYVSESELFEDVPEAGTQNNPIRVPYRSNFLEVISEMVRALPKAARNVYGQPVEITHAVYPKVYPSQQDVTGSIILVNRIVRIAIKPFVPDAPYPELFSQDLGELLRIVIFLDIPSLVNALSSYSVSDFPDSLTKQIINPRLTPDLMKARLNAVLRKERLGNFPDPVLDLILKKLKIERFLHTPYRTIADHIGEKGQPRMVPRNRWYAHTNFYTIYLKNHSLTDLLGLDLILSKSETEKLELQENYFFASDFNQDILGLSSALFEGWRSLQILNLNNNKAQLLPENLFSGLTSLNELRLGGNQLQLLPENLFSGLTSLNELRLGGNQLQQLPENLFSGLTNLQWLELENNQLQLLPEKLFSGLTSLRVLDLSDNQLHLLPENLFSGLTALEVLLFKNNQLQLLPENIFSGLTNLKKVDLQNNQLQQLPEKLFSGLTNLRILDLSYNQLQLLPENLFSGLTNLEVLFLSYNFLPGDTHSDLAKMLFKRRHNLDEGVHVRLSPQRSKAISTRCCKNRWHGRYSNVNTMSNPMMPCFW